MAHCTMRSYIEKATLFMIGRIFHESEYMGVSVGENHWKPRKYAESVVRSFMLASV